MTGRHPNRMGCFTPGRPLRPQEMTVAQAVQAAGYATGHFGKWHLNGVSGPGKPIAADDPLNPGRFGFDEWLSVSNYFETDWTMSRRGAARKNFTGDGSEYIVAQALKFIGDNAKQKKPVLAVVWFGNPHAPHKPMPADQAEAGGSAYYGEILAIDRSMGRLREGLRTLGIAENTLLWFCSDNGGGRGPARPAGCAARSRACGRAGSACRAWSNGPRRSSGPLRPTCPPAPPTSIPRSSISSG